MSEPENFLTRWSRRKREVEQHEASTQDEVLAAESAPGPILPQHTTETAIPDGASETASETESFDPATLPPLESITAETDIRGYFARGVPAELARAALRRAWASDPAIRDFVGLAENAWDFNAPETIPGFGPITASDDVAGMMRQMMGEARQAARQPGPEPSQLTSPQAPEVPEHLAVRQDVGLDPQGESNAASPLPQDCGQEETLAGHDDGEPAMPMPDAEPDQTPDGRPIQVRGHGGALPK